MRRVGRKPAATNLHRAQTRNLAPTAHLLCECGTAILQGRCKPRQQYDTAELGGLRSGRHTADVGAGWRLRVQEVLTLEEPAVRCALCGVQDCKFIADDGRLSVSRSVTPKPQERWRNKAGAQSMAPAARASSAPATSEGTGERAKQPGQPPRRRSASPRVHVGADLKASRPSATRFHPSRAAKAPERHGDFSGEDLEGAAGGGEAGAEVPLIGGRASRPASRVATKTLAADDKDAAAAVRHQLLSGGHCGREAIIRAATAYRSTHGAPWENKFLIRGRSGCIPCHQCRSDSSVRCVQENALTVRCATCGEGYCMGCLHEKYGYLGAPVNFDAAIVRETKVLTACPACEGLCMCRICCRQGRRFRGAMSIYTAKGDRTPGECESTGFSVSVLGAARAVRAACDTLGCIRGEVLQLAAQQKKLALPELRALHPAEDDTTLEKRLCDVTRVPLDGQRFNCSRCDTSIWDIFATSTSDSCTVDLCLQCCADIRGGEAIIPGPGPAPITVAQAEGSARSEIAMQASGRAAPVPQQQEQPQHHTECPAGPLSAQQLRVRRPVRVRTPADRYDPAAEASHLQVARGQTVADEPQRTPTALAAATPLATSPPTAGQLAAPVAQALLSPQRARGPYATVDADGRLRCAMPDCAACKRRGRQGARLVLARLWPHDWEEEIADARWDRYMRPPPAKPAVGLLEEVPADAAIGDVLHSEFLVCGEKSVRDNLLWSPDWGALPRPKEAPRPSAWENAVTARAEEESVAMFRRQWLAGRPIVVRNVDAGCRMSWSALALRRAVMEGEKGPMADTKLTVLDCKQEGEVYYNMPVKEFWENYEKLLPQGCMANMLERRYLPHVLKLKDWPPGEQFGVSLSRHEVDINEGFPFQMWTHPKDSRVSLMNMATRLVTPEPPSSSDGGGSGAAGTAPPELPDVNRPDLGPKMYTAYGHPDNLSAPGGVGNSCTRLHCDMSDAVNILIDIGGVKETAKSAADAAGGAKMVAGIGLDVGAVWYIWRQDQRQALSSFLRARAASYRAPLPPSAVDDAHAIHDQTYFIHDSHLSELRAAGLAPWIIHQRLGDGIMVPAGCPHQVRNVRSCIKVAVDFVSPENVGQYLALCAEYRRLPEGHRAREDKLGVKLMLLHAAKAALKALKEAEMADAGESEGVPAATEMANVAGVHSSAVASSKEGLEAAVPRRAKRTRAVAPEPAGVSATATVTGTTVPSCAATEAPIAKRRRAPRGRAVGALTAEMTAEPAAATRSRASRGGSAVQTFEGTARAAPLATKVKVRSQTAAASPAPAEARPRPRRAAASMAVSNIAALLRDTSARKISGAKAKELLEVLADNPPDPAAVKKGTRVRVCFEADADNVEFYCGTAIERDGKEWWIDYDDGDRFLEDLPRRKDWHLLPQQLSPAELCRVQRDAPDWVAARRQKRKAKAKENAKGKGVAAPPAVPRNPKAKAKARVKATQANKGAAASMVTSRVASAGSATRTTRKANAAAVAGGNFAKVATSASNGACKGKRATTRAMGVAVPEAAAKRDNVACQPSGRGASITSAARRATATAGRRAPRPQGKRVAEGPAKSPNGLSRGANCVPGGRAAKRPRAAELRDVAEEVSADGFPGGPKSAPGGVSCGADCASEGNASAHPGADKAAEGAPSAADEVQMATGGAIVAAEEVPDIVPAAVGSTIEPPLTSVVAFGHSSEVAAVVGGAAVTGVAADSHVAEASLTQKADGAVAAPAAVAAPGGGGTKSPAAVDTLEREAEESSVAVVAIGDGTAAHGARAGAIKAGVRCTPPLDVSSALHFTPSPSPAAQDESKKKEDLHCFLKGYYE